MFCNLKKILCSTAIALIWGLASGQTAQAQGLISLADEAPQLSNSDSDNFLGVDSSIPDEIALFETANNEDNASSDDNQNEGLINPPADFPALEEENNADTPDLNTEDETGLANITDDAPISLPAPAEQTEHPLEISQPTSGGDTSGEILLNQVDNELFTQMSDLEKQTALLTLELRREKIRNEIEAIKVQRQKAIEEIKAKEEEKARKKLEWEKEQERKLLEEKRKLREISLALEKLRQEKVLNAYKENMLHSIQEWIKNNEGIYEELAKAEEEKEAQIADFKNKINYLSTLAVKTNKDAETARANYNREIDNLQTQISILKARLEAEKAERENSKANPFAQDGSNNTGKVPEAAKEEEEEVTIKLPEEYAVMEIVGKGENLSAKLLNKGGDSFLVRKGTTLQTGHIVDEITQTYVRAEKDGVKDYLYFAAGGILEKEPPKTITTQEGVGKGKKASSEKSSGGSNLMVSDGIPSLGRGMFVR